LIFAAPIKCRNTISVGSGGGQTSQAVGYCSAGAVAANTHSHQQSRGHTVQQQQAYTGSPGYAQTLPASSQYHQHRQQQQQQAHSQSAGSPQTGTMVNGQIDSTDNDLR